MEVRFTSTVGGEEREFFMSYGLLTTLAKICAAREDPTLLSIDPELQMAALPHILKKPGEPLPDLDLVPLTPEEGDRLIEWATGHVLDFFLTGLERTKSLSESQAGRIASLMPSSAGTKA